MSKPSKKYKEEMEIIDRELAELARLEQLKAEEEVNKKYPNFEGVTYTEEPKLTMWINTLKPILIRLWIIVIIILMIVYWKSPNDKLTPQDLVNISYKIWDVKEIQLNYTWGIINYKTKIDTNKYLK